MMHVILNIFNFKVFVPKMIQPSTVEDIPELLVLIHSAYRGEGSKRGWTTEADILDGSRIYDSTLQKYIENSNSVLVKYTNEAEFEDDRILACVYLDKVEKKNELKCYLGLLTVSPELQGRGIGKQLLQFANDWARSQGCVSIIMTVISSRVELIAWYERHGFSITDEREPFFTDPEFGLPKQDIEFAVLEKRF